jgi:hypothetical protein
VHSTCLFWRPDVGAWHGFVSGELRSANKHAVGACKRVVWMVVQVERGDSSAHSPWLVRGFWMQDAPLLDAHGPAE